MKKNESNTYKNFFIILCCSVCAKLLSYAVEVFLAASLGVSEKADALYMTIGVFNVLYPILDLGIWKVFLPEYKKKLVMASAAEADETANRFESLCLVASFVLVVLILILAKPLVVLIAPGYSPELKAMTAHYLRLSAPMFFCMMTASILGAVLQCHNKFLGSQIREIATHLSKIIVLVAFYRTMGVYAAILALVLGSVFRVLAQIPFIDWKWKFRFDLELKDQSIKTILRGLPSVAVTAAIAQVNALVDRMVASTLPEGSVSQLNYGGKLIHVFGGLLTGAVSTAIYPQTVELAAKNDKDALRTLVSRALIASIVLIVPVELFCLAFSKDVVVAAFQRGAFDANASSASAAVFFGYAIGTLFSGLPHIISNVDYAYGDTKLTMRISLLNISVNIVLNLILSRIWGVFGLAFATSIANMVGFSARLIILRRYIQVEWKNLASAFGKSLIAGLFSCAAAYALISLLPDNAFLRLAVSLAVMTPLYLAAIKILRIREAEMLLDILRKKLKRG